MTQRSLVQIQPRNHGQDEGLAVSAAGPFVVLVPVLTPAHCVILSVGQLAAIEPVSGEIEYEALLGIGGSIDRRTRHRGLRSVGIRSRPA